MSRPMYSLESILDKALNGVELSNEPAELSAKEKEKQEKWERQQKEKEEQAAKMQAELLAHREKLRKGVEAALKEMHDREAEQKAQVAEPKPVAPASSVSWAIDQIVNDLIDCRDREERLELEEALLMAVKDFSNSLTDPDKCYPSEDLDIKPERFVRSFSDRKRYLFCNGWPVRPSFFLQDKDSDQKAFLPAWSMVNGSVLSFEFGSKIPMRRTPDGERVPNGTIPVPYFSVQYWSSDGGFRNAMLKYQREDDEFTHLQKRIDDFFGKIMSESRKQFEELRYVLDKHAPGIFNKGGKTSEGIRTMLNDYLRAGGDTNKISYQVVPGNRVVIFDLNCRYILVNTSHRKATVVYPEKAVEEGISGFAKTKDGKISTFLPSQLALIEIDGPNMTIVRGE